MQMKKMILYFITLVSTNNLYLESNLIKRGYKLADTTLKSTDSPQDFLRFECQTYLEIINICFNTKFKRNDGYVSTFFSSSEEKVRFHHALNEFILLFKDVIYNKNSIINNIIEFRNALKIIFDEWNYEENKSIFIMVDELQYIEENNNESMDYSD